ncbi:FolB domain-containing protein [Escherichia coli]|nr:FolB domain-containing protein [Escherichia coli]MDN2243627.1 FolB domain-containing protein [Escherichia coli]
MAQPAAIIRIKNLRLRTFIGIKEEEINNRQDIVINVTIHYPADKARTREGANKRGNSSRLTQSFHFFMFEPIFSPVNALNQPI